MNNTLPDYFKASPKRRRLSLIKKESKETAGPKDMKRTPENADIGIINLVSDDEEKESNISGISAPEENHSQNSSSSTIIYTPGTPRKSQTPSRLNSKSPGSHRKFYSPVKKKNIKLRTPTKVKKNLCNIMDSQEQDQVFSDASVAMDDKTIFLLKIIYKYLNDKELRPLLLEKSQDLLSKSMHVKAPGMRLICRLYWRKEGWYKLDQIKQISIDSKNDIGDPAIQDMINNLIESDIIESANYQGSKHTVDLEGCLNLLKSDELKAICKDLKLKASSKKENKECLRTYCRQKTNISSYFIGSKTDNASRVLKMLTSKLGPCFRLTDSMRQTLHELHLIMYLGIHYSILREKKLELTLIYDKIKRECYPVDKDMPTDNASVVFKTRDEFERYLQASNIYEEFLSTTNTEDKCHIVENVYKLYTTAKETMLSYRTLPPWLQKFTPPYLYVKILEEGIQELKKTKSDTNIALALDILSELISQHMFRQHKKALWYAEKALILDKFLSDPDKAAQVLLCGFSSGMPEAAKDHLRPRAAALASRRAHGVSAELRARLQLHDKDDVLERNLNAHHIYKQPMDIHKNKGKIKFETRTADGRVVQEAEEFCISHYIANGKYTHGGHWEGRIVTTIFFLLFWDIIYARLRDVRGIYLTHYQKYPLDMFLDSFYVNRKVLVEDRLREIENTPIADLVWQMGEMWNCRPETELSDINRAIGWENVRSVCLCLNPRHLAAICRRLAIDYRYAQSGFPDLTLWNEDTNEIKFVEVKTDSDKPSMKQIQWMHYLQESGIDTEFCYVGVNTTRCRARNSNS